MKVLVTGSSGHLGEGLVRTLRDAGHDVIGLDIEPSEYTTIVGSIGERSTARSCMRGVQAVYHTATLHKPHVWTHSPSAFVDTNVQGTLALLEAAVRQGVESFVFTSTTSVFGDAMRPRSGSPAVWVTEALQPVPRNIYGVTKNAAEDLCHLFHRKYGLRCVILRTSRFFSEEDDDQAVRDAYDGQNAKVNELLYRRVDLEDVVNAHLLAAEKAPSIGFGRYIVSATTPFTREDLTELGANAPAALRTRFPEYEEIYRRRGWKMFPSIDRVYVNDAAREDLGWKPRVDFAHALESLARDAEPWSDLTRAVGSKGYHSLEFDEGPYPIRRRSAP